MKFLDEHIGGIMACCASRMLLSSNLVDHTTRPLTLCSGDTQEITKKATGIGVDWVVSILSV